MRVRHPRFLPLLLIASVIFLFLKTFIADIYIVREESMRPGLPPDTVVLVVKAAYGIRNPFGGWLWRYSEPAAGEVAAFADAERPGGFAVKRVTATAGDVVRSSNGSILVNGHAVGVQLRPAPFAELVLEELVVPAATAFVLGDNREKSRDSRHFGVLSNERLLGRVACVLYPFSRFGEVP